MNHTKAHRVTDNHSVNARNERGFSAPLEVDADPMEKSSLGAGNLHSGWMLASFMWLWDIILTMLSILFVALALIVMGLNGQPVSEYGKRVVEITRLSQTIYPILFAMVASRFYRNLARWSLERPHGIKMSWLEQIYGSLSFATAAERVVTVWSNIIIGILILVSWSLSPIGGRGSSRLLYVTLNSTTSDGIVYYAYMDSQRPSYEGGLSLSSVSSILTTVYSANLLSPATQQRAFSDIYGRPRIPQWPLETDQTPVGSWRQVNGPALIAGNEYYTSFVGTKVQGLSFTDTTSQYNFSLHSFHIDFVCNISPIYNAEGGTCTLDDMLIQDTGKNSSQLVIYEYKFGIAFPLDENGKAFRGENLPKHLLYASLGFGSYTVITCPMQVIDIETNIRCDARGCSPVRQRRIPSPRPQDKPWPNSMSQGATMYNLVIMFPSLAGGTRGDQASPSENYLANDEYAFVGQERRVWKDELMPIFSRRMTTLFNTAWQVGLNPRNISTQFTADAPLLDEKNMTNQVVQINMTSASVSRTRDVYRADRSWVALLLLTTAVFEVLALAGFALQLLIMGPDILGFASSLTQDSRFVPVHGGSSLDGAERARLLGDLRLRLADVRTEEDDGYIAVSTMPATSSELSGDEQVPGLTWRPLDKNRVYS
ncbi:hypothetical protein CSOJ01_08629 [Colletotrichum sojae]|uniref:Uncharacterized protein n=1 Tax=Colletotrichum sojae TaxID=2175907 RepID=A0A8H6J595_9PEZI|nr:hypothetical protein CSOJ01_08629 [Colletotrichum sojae]